ncbi:hypothetical protein PR048_020728 [Dryococelus australis]|uniref:Uncharacterized protein n=1 Tax=Dryococelus australis TaxID=614101 RepID=A0ABQ9H796_9NEOP|nr:hypothetical protein PR048_020728 [Dryococelus australis]
MDCIQPYNGSIPANPTEMKKSRIENTAEVMRGSKPHIMGERLPAALFTLRTRTNLATGKTPAKVLQGCNLTLPGEFTSGARECASSLAGDEREERREGGARGTRDSDVVCVAAAACHHLNPSPAKCRTTRVCQNTSAFSKAEKILRRVRKEVAKSRSKQNATRNTTRRHSARLHLQGIPQERMFWLLLTLPTLSTFILQVTYKTRLPATGHNVSTRHE